MTENLGQTHKVIGVVGEEPGDPLQRPPQPLDQHHVAIARPLRPLPLRRDRRLRSGDVIETLRYLFEVRGAPRHIYYASSGCRSLARACDQAFPPPEPLAKREKESQKAWWERLTDEQRGQVRRWQREHRWHPHQLRHNAATELRRQFGIETARIILGHRSAAITEVYAELDQAKAVEAMKRVG